MGASNFSLSFASRLDDRLRETASGVAAVVNGGLNGGKARQVADMYLENFLRFRPSLVVVNLGCNDGSADPTRPRPNYAVQLQRIVDANKEAGIPTLLVNEAVSVEQFEDGLPINDVMPTIAAVEDSVYFADAFAELKSKYHTGFLFWDLVHPTDYGHALLADFLAPRIEAILEAH